MEHALHPRGQMLTGSPLKSSASGQAALAQANSSVLAALFNSRDLRLKNVVLESCCLVGLIQNTKQINAIVPGREGSVVWVVS